MSRNDLLTQKKQFEALILANLLEVDYIRDSKGIDLAMLNSYYVSERALMAEHLQIMSQLDEVE